MRPKYEFPPEEIVARRSFIETIVYTALKETMSLTPKERAEVLSNVFLEQIETMSLIYPELWEEFLKLVEKYFNKMFYDVIPPIKLNPGLYDFRGQMRKHLIKYVRKLPLNCPRSDWSGVKKEIDFIINRIVLISAQATLYKFKLLR